MAAARVQEKFHQAEVVSLKCDRGPPLTVQKPVKKELKFEQTTHDTMIKMKISLNLSNHQTLGIAKILRELKGAQRRKAVEGNLQDELKKHTVPVI